MIPVVAPARAAIPSDTAWLEGKLTDLRHLVQAACSRPQSRLGMDFYREHVLVVERFARSLAPLLGARLDIVLPAAVVHDIAAIEDFTRVAEHHILGAQRAETILRDLGFADEQIAAASACVLRHVQPVAPGDGTVEEVCLSNADSLAQMANPSYWLHYAEKVRALDFPAGRDWYLAMVKDRYPKLHPAASDLARPHFLRAVGACQDDQLRSLP